MNTTTQQPHKHKARTLGRTRRHTSGGDCSSMLPCGSMITYHVLPSKRVKSWVNPYCSRTVVKFHPSPNCTRYFRITPEPEQAKKGRGRPRRRRVQDGRGGGKWDTWSAMLQSSSIKKQRGCTCKITTAHAPCNARRLSCIARPNPCYSADSKKYGLWSW